MSIKDGVERLIKKAKDEASEMAQTARLKLDLRQLEGRRDLLYGKIGRRVYKKRDQGMDPVELQPIFSELTELEAEMQTKEAELRALSAQDEPKQPPS